jgi:hypothetical protein
LWPETCILLDWYQSRLRRVSLPQSHTQETGAITWITSVSAAEATGQLADVYAGHPPVPQVHGEHRVVGESPSTKDAGGDQPASGPPRTGTAGRRPKAVPEGHGCGLKMAFILVGFLLLLLLLEALFPLRHRTWALVRRLIVNLGVSALAFAAAAWMSAKSFGLLHLVPLPAVVQVGLAFLLMALTFYYWHLANHKLPVLWRFHNVHHIDPDLDVSTALRFHVGEVVLSAGFRVLQVSLIGLPPLIYMIYEGVFQANTLFQHRNVRLPLQVERLLNTVLVSVECCARLFSCQLVQQRLGLLEVGGSNALMLRTTAVLLEALTPGSSAGGRAYRAGRRPAG